MYENFDKRNIAIVLRYVLTPGGKYVPALESTAVLRNSRQAHQEHLRLWARMLKCKEVHFGFREEETYVYSYAGGYCWLRSVRQVLFKNKCIRWSFYAAISSGAVVLCS